MANRHRPRRGPAGGSVLVSGDTGTTAGPQDGARPGASESGDLDSREFGVPQADIPGGLRHKVNPETTPAQTADKQLRPADEHKYHGVPPLDFGPYEDVPGVEHDKPARPAPEPKLTDAVPVRIVEEGSGKRKVIRAMTTIGPLTIANGDTAPHRVCDRDPGRVSVFFMNENGTRANALRVGTRAECDQGAGYFIGGASGSGFELKGVQDEIYVWNPSAAAITWSALIITEIPASGI